MYIKRNDVCRGKTYGRQFPNISQQLLCNGPFSVMFVTSYQSIHNH